jgi:hypothetical protein
MYDGMCVLSVDAIAYVNAARRCKQFGVSHICPTSHQAVLDGPIADNGSVKSDAHFKGLVGNGLWLDLGEYEGGCVVSQPHLHPHLSASIATFLVESASDGDFKPSAQRSDESRRANIATLVRVASLQSFCKVVKFFAAESPMDKVGILFTRDSEGDKTARPKGK